MGRSTWASGAARAMRLGILVGAMTGQAPGDVVYVDDDAPPGGDGTSWSTAFRYLREALPAAVGPPVEVRVAQGLYVTDQSEAAPTGDGDRTHSFAVHADVALRGGFAGIGSPDPDQRDPSRFVTTLSGVVTGARARHVVQMDGKDCELSGVTVTGGLADGEYTYSHGSGGGVEFDDDAGSALIVDCRITDNAASQSGGGMWLGGGPAVVRRCVFDANEHLEFGSAGGAGLSCGRSALIEDCSFVANVAAMDGAGAWGRGTFLRCRFESNVGYRGGGANGQDATFHECVFIGNTGISGGGVLLNRGCTMTSCVIEGNSADGAGGIAADGSSSGVVTIADTIVRGNSALERGGGIGIYGPVRVSRCTVEENEAAEGGGLLISSAVDVEITDCAIAENIAGDGGGLRAYHSSLPCAAAVTATEFRGNLASTGGALSIGPGAVLSATDCVLDDNHALVDGGAVFVQSAAPSFESCSFVGNSANEVAGEGGAVAATEWAAPALVDCTFEANASGLGGAVAANFHATLLVEDCVLISNEAEQGGGIGARGAGPITVRGTTLEGNFAPDLGGALYLRDGQLDIEGSTFQDNNVWNRGGALAVIDATTAVRQTDFVGNEAWNGGCGIAVEGTGSLDVRTSVFREQIHLSQPGTEIRGRAGEFGAPSLVRVEDCVFEDVVGTPGAAISVPTVTALEAVASTFRNYTSTSDTASVLTGGPITARACVFEGNTVWGIRSAYADADRLVEDCTFDNRGVSIRDGRVVVRRCSFTAAPGALSIRPVFIDEAEGYIEDSTFVANQTQVIGDRDSRLVVEGCEFRPFSAPGEGVAIVSSGPELVVRNCRIEGKGIGILIDHDCRADIANVLILDCDRSFYIDGEMLVSNATLFGNTTIQMHGSRLHVRNSFVSETEFDLQYGSEIRFDYCNLGFKWDGAGWGNITADPRFVDAERRDFHLLPDSPHIDRGWGHGVARDVTDLDQDSVTTEFVPIDLDGAARVMDARASAAGCAAPVDIGAYEFGGTPIAAIPGDADIDGVVGTSDLLLVLAQWDGVAACVADVTGDGAVDVQDVLLVLARWSG